jgi:hypothetical protein
LTVFRTHRHSGFTKYGILVKSDTAAKERLAAAKGRQFS